jgi:hypothetical protein
VERNTLPPFFSTGDPDSFARRTLQVRKPAILDRIVAANDFSDEQKSAMRALKEEVLHGTIPDTLAGRTDLHGIDSYSVAMWMQSLEPYAGRSWLDIPFYFAEAFLYFSILLAIGYFDHGSTYYLRDPYQLFKDDELHAGRGGMEIGRVLVDSLAGVEDRRVYLRSILHSALWGNRVDLSLFSIAEKSRERVLAERGDNLLIDHSEELIGLIERADRIDFILDNSGQELVCDLIAVWHILSHAPCKEVVLHAKRYPFYVSDAMIKDIFQTVGSFTRDTHPSIRGIGSEIEARIEGGSVMVKDHPFWNGPLHYPDLPGELRDDLACSDLVILKGDINYRRTVSDRRWRVSERLEEITGYFPTNFALLRTMKSEAVVDIDEARAARLAEEDPEWKVNGERGLIRVVHRG